MRQEIVLRSFAAASRRAEAWDGGLLCTWARRRRRGPGGVPGAGREALPAAAMTANGPRLPAPPTPPPHTAGA